MRTSLIEEEALTGDRRRLSGNAVFGDGGEVPVFYEFPDFGPVAAPGDPWLPLLIAPAMALHEDLYIDAPVSKGLLEAANERIGPVLAGFHSEFAQVEVHAAEVVEDRAPRPAAGTAAFYSGGLDSAYMFSRQAERLSHLVYVHGFDIGPEAESTRCEVARRIRALAERNGLELLEMSSNARRAFAHAVQKRYDARHPVHVPFSRDRQLGNLLASFAQPLACQLGRVVFAASWSIHEGARIPGSHPWVEDNWSNPALAIELDGWEADRSQKTATLARHRPELLRTVRVCQARPPQPDNCGRCAKCTRLRIELAVGGVPEENAPFEGPLDHAAVRRSGIVGGGGLWRHLLATARESGDPEIIHTIEVLTGHRKQPGALFGRTRRKLQRGARRLVRRLR
ncbi:MAG: hypothetical protein JRH10_06020 [Deltaproteobacteria bacterium]|nr:hypothetical protein [Deltaproteobacteria bacterium]